MASLFNTDILELARTWDERVAFNEGYKAQQIANARKAGAESVDLGLDASQGRDAYFARNEVDDDSDSVADVGINTDDLSAVADTSDAESVADMSDEQSVAASNSDDEPTISRELSGKYFGGSEDIEDFNYLRDEYAAWMRSEDADITSSTWH